MTNRNIAIGLVVCVALGYSLGRYFQPPKVETVEVTKEVIKKDVVTVVKEVVRPDGTKETETTTTDRTTETSNTSNSSKVAIKPAWKVNAMVGYNIGQPKVEYGVMAQKNFIGPISLGAYATTERTIGVTVGLEF